MLPGKVVEVGNTKVFQAHSFSPGESESRHRAAYGFTGDVAGGLRNSNSIQNFFSGYPSAAERRLN
jgi:hypothetical protein